MHALCTFCGCANIMSTTLHKLTLELEEDENKHLEVVCYIGEELIYSGGFM